MNNSCRKTKYLLTINNPEEHGLDRTTLITKCRELDPRYFCMSDEIGLEEKTPHTHIFIIFYNPRSFNTIKKTFEAAHIDPCNGTSQDCIDYVFKEGKWKDDEKSDTRIEDTQFEEGDKPPAREGKKGNLADVYQLIVEGVSPDDIIDMYPQYWTKRKDIEAEADRQYQRKHVNDDRNLRVIYIYGSPGSGKTRWVLDYFGRANVFRVTNFAHPFDKYKRQKVLFIDEFNNNIAFEEMLVLTDIYNADMNSRFFDKTAAYEYVVIASNIPFHGQYSEIIQHDNSRWRAFVRRITYFADFFSFTDRQIYKGYENYTKRISMTLAELEKELEVNDNEQA